MQRNATHDSFFPSLTIPFNQEMPSTNNPNLPRSEKHKIRTRKAAKAKARFSSRTASQPAALRGHGVTKPRTTNTKKQKKLARNQIYTEQRKVEAAAEELLKTKGEVEMADVATVPLSKRQLKLAERAAKTAEHNAKTKANVMEIEQPVEVVADGEPTMDVD